MKSVFILSALFSFGYCNPEWAHNPPTLDPKQPIYLGNVFHPPEMHFFAYTPPKDPNDLFTLSKLDWCKSAQEITENMSTGSRTPALTFEGMDGLKFHDYFTDKAYISRYNAIFAECNVGPYNPSIGYCPGDTTKGHKFKGMATRGWACWIVNKPSRKGVLGPREDTEVEKETTAEKEILRGTKTGAMVGSSGQTAFTATATGR